MRKELFIIILFGAFAFFNACGGGGLSDSEPPAEGNALSYYFPSKVVEFVQAPGKFANHSEYGMASNSKKVLGPPKGGGAHEPNNSSIVSLGSGGGFIVVEFDKPIKNEDSTVNYKGYDFIVFGNSFLISGKKKFAAEPGVVWVGVDEDNSGDFTKAKWYVVPGSHINSTQANMTEHTEIYSRTDSTKLPLDKELYPSTDLYPSYSDEMSLKLLAHS